MSRLIFSPRPAVFLVLTCCLAWSTALADPPAVYLAEGNAIVPTTIIITTTTTLPIQIHPVTTTTTTTLPTIPRCPDAPFAGADAGSVSGINFWYDPSFVCDTRIEGYSLFCFENPWVDVSSSHRVDRKDLGLWRWFGGDPGWQSSGGEPLRMNLFLWYYSNFERVAPVFIAQEGATHPKACYVCGCVRVVGCFAPGVKITMADGSLRNIEDVRAGDLVRNAKTVPL